MEKKLEKKIILCFLKILTRLDEEYELEMLELDVEFCRLPLPKLADLGPVELKWFFEAWDVVLLELFPVQDVGPLLPPFRGDLLASENNEGNKNQSL